MFGGLCIGMVLKTFKVRTVPNSKWSTPSLSNQGAIASFRFAQQMILGRWNTNFIHMRMRQICHSSVLPNSTTRKGLYKGRGKDTKFDV